MKKPTVVRVVGTGGEYTTADGSKGRNLSRTIPLTRKAAAEYLRHIRRTSIRGFVQTLRVESVEKS